MASDKKPDTIEDKLKNTDSFKRTLKSVRATTVSQMQQLADYEHEVESGDFQGELPADYPECIHIHWHKKMAEVKALDTLKGALELPADPHVMGIFQDLVDVFSEIEDTENAYGLLGQNPVADRLYLMLQFKTTQLGLHVDVYKRKRRAEKARRRDEAFEKEMFDLGFALGFWNFGNRP